MSINDRRFYSVDEVAQRLGLQVRTVRGYVRSGRLKAVRIGKQYRVTREALEELTGTSADAARPDVPRRRHVRVSSIVRVDAISPESAQRVTTMLLAAAKSPRDEDEPLRVDSGYDEERGQLEVFISGSPVTTIGMLKMVAKLTES